MSSRRIITFAVLCVVLVLVGAELFSLFLDSKKLSKENIEITQKIQALEQESQKVQGNQNYYRNPDNLEKSLREKFNYKRPGEIMIIVVPEKQP